MTAGRVAIHFSLHKLVMQIYLHPFFTKNTYSLPNSVSENRQWDRCATSLRIGQSKQHVKTGKVTPLTIKHILTNAKYSPIENANSLAQLTKL